MEVWLAQMGPVGSTANVLEAQIREQKVAMENWTDICEYNLLYVLWCKVYNYKSICLHLQSFHAEVHQYKSHIEEFNHLTQELISTYQTDDTAKLKKITEIINQR